MGDCKLSTLLGRRGLFVRRGDEGAIMGRAGECCRLVDMTEGRIKLLRLRSRELAILVRPSSEDGDSARLGPDLIDDLTLVSLSAPVSLSKCIDCLLLCVGMAMAPAYERGVVVPPRGLLDLVESATDDPLRLMRTY